MAKWTCKKCGHQNGEADDKKGNAMGWIVASAGLGLAFGAGAVLVVLLIAVMQAVTGSDGGASFNDRYCKKCNNYRSYLES